MYICTPRKVSICLLTGTFILLHLIYIHTTYPFYTTYTVYMFPSQYICIYTTYITTPHICIYTTYGISIYLQHRQCLHRCWPVDLSTPHVYLCHIHISIPHILSTCLLFNIYISTPRTNLHHIYISSPHAVSTSLLACRYISIASIYISTQHTHPHQKHISTPQTVSTLLA